MAIYFTSMSLPDLIRLIQTHISDEMRRKLHFFYCGMTRSVSRWLRAELTLCAVTFSELLIGFLFLRQPYALLLGLLITLVDALPVFGTGTVLIPWGIVEILLGNTPKAVALTILYALTFLVRNALEPRLLGAQAGLPPIMSLLAMYLGFCIFGVTGMILFPFLLLLASQLKKNPSPRTEKELIS